MRALVVVEHGDGVARDGSLGLLAAACELFGDVTAIVCGHGLAEVVEGVSRVGPASILVVEARELEDALPQPRVDVLARFVRERGFDVILFEASTLATDVAAGLADRLEAGLNWDLVGLEVRGDELVGRRLALQDSVVVEVGWVTDPKVALLRPGVFEPRPGKRTPDVEVVEARPEAWSLQTRLVARERERATGPGLAGAEVVVSGGRGVGGTDGFILLEDLAEALGGAVGASLPAVEIGWRPTSALVGQSGRIVSPRLYIACGISGAVQHRIGMEGAATIVAINTDPDAPIFDFCDLAVVGDLHEIVPALVELLRARRGGRLTDRSTSEEDAHARP